MIAPVQKDLDIREYTDPNHNPMIPHTLVLKPGLVIHRIYNGYWFWGRRPSVIGLWHDLRAVTSEIRPDWDLSTPGLRDDWNAGDFSLFRAWNKRTKPAPVTEARAVTPVTEQRFLQRNGCPGKGGHPLARCVASRRCAARWFTRRAARSSGPRPGRPAMRW